ncbi:NAD(P)/FAD-dependent oxidoreductase [Bradyrhizobium lablabi]|uniref:NAD(P)/FAD-dependent oxidoreductase n=1 Tax=Bradyrhizobium lablabi TaxID=722472 RepID=UPI001BACF396|nr:NAD(P)/FAD-dependent oxidoreductase [Bradyrhizobium lablabi]MBR1125453.1 NAD(P)/FAD-dependent oxidoreductase [Bradyrhizobium lablabi]
MGKAFDVIVVGARCAGSATAMLLSRRGYRVLAVDRASFPSDTVSTHILHPLAVGALARWGLLDRLAATGCPAIDTYVFDFGAFTISGAPGTEENPVAYCPRRTILDKLLVDAAAESGTEIREGFGVEEIVIEGERVVGIKGRSKHGSPVTEYADVVVGADGRHSMVSEAVRAEPYRERPCLLAGYYSYWRGLPMDGRFESYVRDRRAFAVAPTHDDLTLVIAGWPYAEFAENRKDVEGNYLKTIELAPEFAKRLRSATRVAPFAGTAVPNYFRKPFGHGWALVGDAGYNKDFVTAQGILDAFRDAELCAGALDESLSGARSFDDAMADYQRLRDERGAAMYDFTCELATLEPPPPELLRLLLAVQGNQAAMDGFARLNAGTILPAEFFAPDNTEAILAAAAAMAHGAAGSPRNDLQNRPA